MYMVQGELFLSRWYVENSWLNCPVCGAKTDHYCSYGDPEAENTIVFQEVYCERCESTWTQKFELYEIGEVELGPGYRWDDEDDDPNDHMERPDPWGGGGDEPGGMEVSQ